MSSLHLICKEILHRKGNFLLSLLAVIIAVALFVSFFTTGQASKRETIRLMRNLGYNVRIINKNTDMNKFWSTGFSDRTMPEEYVSRFASQQNVLYNHLTAVLHKKVSWRDKEVIVTGLSSTEVAPPDKKKSPMGFVIDRGNVYVGYEIANGFGIEEGDIIDLFGARFTVARTLSPSGTDDDIRIFGLLGDIQGLFDMKGQINEIKALNCFCLDEGVDTLVLLRRQLQTLLPEAQVIQVRDKALVREKQRLMAEKYFAFIVPFALIVSAAWIGVLAMINVRERKHEIGVMRAIGYGSGKIAELFLGKALLIGITGAAIGFLIGTGLALTYGPGIFAMTAKKIEPLFALLLWSLIAAPALSAIASFIPAMIAATQDPASILREE